LTRYLARNLDGATADLGIAQPGTGILAGRIIGGRMDHHSRIPPQIGRLDRAGHHSHHHVAIDKFDLDPADSGSAIPSYGRQRLVAAKVKHLPDAAGEVWFGGD
jgi:hypothetical protein